MKVSIKHIYRQVERHEESVQHTTAVGAYKQAYHQQDIANLLNNEQQVLRKNNNELKRKVVRRLMNIILFLDRQGLAYRGSEEGSHSLDNFKVNHGNFLKTVLLVVEYDPILKKHINDCIQRSEEHKTRQNKSKYGRGSMITFLSKAFINKLIC